MNQEPSIKFISQKTIGIFPAYGEAHCQTKGMMGYHLYKNGFTLTNSMSFLAKVDQDGSWTKHCQ